MKPLSQRQFLHTLGPVVQAALPAQLQSIQIEPQNWLLKLHFGEKRLHYEVSRVRARPAWELGLHFEARDKRLNRFLLLGMRRHLFEIKDELGGQVVAEMWDRGWTKVYELMPDDTLTPAYQTAVAERLARFITCVHPIFVALRQDVRTVYW